MFALSATDLIACVLVPRFELVVTAGRRSGLLGAPVAIAPEPGGQRIGEVSAAAEAFGVGRGMRLGEALARCRQLILLPPDPSAVQDRWEQVLGALESSGAAVETLGQGVACFDIGGLLRLYGGAQAVLGVVLSAVGMPVRCGVAQARFVAVMAARGARPRQPLILAGGQRQARAFLAPLPIEALSHAAHGDALEPLTQTLRRLGIGTLGELAALPRAHVADRFGRAGLEARELALGYDTSLRTRRPAEAVCESLELPESAGGEQLERALGLLVDRLLARPERRGRTLRAVILSAALVEGGGSWRQQVTFRESLSDPVRMRLALTPRLQLLPAPVQALTLTVERFGPATGEQRALLEEPARARATRLREAVRQTRAGAGPEAVLRILYIDPRSRYPERRAILTPFE